MFNAKLIRPSRHIQQAFEWTYLRLTDNDVPISLDTALTPAVEKA